MTPTQFYPLIQTHGVLETAEFYMENFGFKAMFESDWYFHLQSKADPSVNLAILQAEHETIPQEARGVTRNIILSFEVGDAAVEDARLRSKGVHVVQRLRDEPHGQRHAIYRDPNGVLIDVITPIEPSAEFLAGYTEKAVPA